VSRKPITLAIILVLIIFAALSVAFVSAQAAPHAGITGSRDFTAAGSMYNSQSAGQNLQFYDFSPDKQHEGGCHDEGDNSFDL